MEFRQLQHFIVVAQTLNFTKAAKQSFISQQALSKSIRMLEEELGVPLFERLPRGLALTEYGQILLSYGYEISESIFRAHSEIQLKKYASSLNIAIALTAGVEDTFPIHILFEYQKKHPEYQLTTMLNNDRIIEQMLEKESLDFAIVGARGDTDNIEYTPLIKSSTYVLVNRKNPLSQKDLLCLEDLKNEKFLFSSTDYNVNKQFLSTCQLLGFTPNICHNSAGIKFMLLLAIENQGILFATDNIVSASIDPSLKAIPLANDPYFFHIHIAIKKGKKLSLAAKELLDYIKTQVPPEK